MNANFSALADMRFHLETAAKQFCPVGHIDQTQAVPCFARLETFVRLKTAGDPQAQRRR